MNSLLTCPQMDVAVNANYCIRISDATEDPEWDTFLRQTPGGHHVQTSLWAQVKGTRGWQAVRLVVTRGERIVAGAQLLMRPLPWVGFIGYVPKGPLITLDEPLLTELVINELKRVAKVYRVQHLTIQPPCNVEGLAQHLLSLGFQSSITSVAPTATVLLDLTKELDTILAEMNPKTRYNLRLGQRKGVRIREGTDKDLPTYYRILKETSLRQGFSPYPEQYFTKMWRVLNPFGYVKLFLAEYEGEVVSAQLAVPFGDTMINKLSVWSGRHGKHRPNEVLQWAAIKWAKSHGYHYYDFEGINPEAAKATLRQDSLPNSLKQSVTSFKIGFGGQVVLFPGAHVYVNNRLLRWTYTAVFSKNMNRAVVKQMLNRFRTR